jgi:hypothetical protein
VTVVGTPFLFKDAYVARGLLAGASLVAPCSGTPLGRCHPLGLHGRIQVHQCAACIEGSVDALDELQADTGLGELDLGDVLRRVTGEVREPLQRQGACRATGTQFRAQPSGARGIGID